MISRRRLAVLTITALGAQPTFAADGLRCSAFLHERDGKWRSFETADIFGANGVVHLKSGERIDPTDGTPKGGIARALNEICEK